MSGSTLLSGAIDRVFSGATNYVSGAIGSILPSATPLDRGQTNTTTTPTSGVGSIQTAATNFATGTIGSIGSSITSSIFGSKTKTNDPSNPDAVNFTGSLGTNDFQDKPMIPNILSQYHSPIANWRLFIIAPEDFNKMQDKKNLQKYWEMIHGFKQITIAETGSTAFNIKSVSFTSVIGGENNRNAMKSLNTFSVKVVEPYGTKFVDGLIAGCAQLHIPNWKQFPLQIELTFKAIDPNTGKPVVIPFRRLWPVTLQMINNHFTLGTTEYTLSLVPYRFQGDREEHIKLKHQLHITGETVGDIIQKLMDDLNKGPKISAGNVARLRHQYDVKYINKNLLSNELGVSPDIASWKLIPSGTGSFRPSSQEGYTMDVANNTTTATISAGTDIKAFISNLFASTNEGQKLMGAYNEQQQKIQKEQEEIRKQNNQAAQPTSPTASTSTGNGPMNNIFGYTGRDTSGSGANGAGGAGANSSTKPAQNVFNIVTIDQIVDLMEYNTVAAAYNTDVHLFIGFREFNHLVTQEKAKQKAKTQIELAKEKRELSKRTNKRYRFEYTGLNTEVLDLKIDFNINWQAFFPKNQGFYSYNLMRDGKLLDPVKWKTIEKARANQEYYNTLLRLEQLDKPVQTTPQPNQQTPTDQNNPQNQQNPQDQATTQTPNGQPPAQQAQTEDQRVKREQERQTLQGKLEQLKQKADPIFVDQATQEIADVLANQKNQMRHDTTVTAPLSGMNYRYTEDAADRVKDAMAYYTNLEAYSGQISITEETIPESSVEVQNQIETEWNTSRTLMGAHLNQFFNQTSQAGCQMSIRGDPWWIGSDEYQHKYYLYSLTDTQANSRMNGGEIAVSPTERLAEAAKVPPMLNEVFYNFGGENIPDFLNHAHYYHLITGLPSGYNSSTGIPNVKNGGYIEGLYTMRTVTHHFDEQGKFTQQIEGTRVPLTVLSQIPIKGDEETEGAPPAGSGKTEGNTQVAANPAPSAAAGNPPTAPTVPTPSPSPPGTVTTVRIP